MTIDADGYGYRGDEARSVQRLLEDCRTLSPAGIERAARGWDRHVGEHGLDDFHAAEKAALHVIETTDAWPAWDDARRTLFGLTEGEKGLISWRAEHGEIGHKAERALQAAALALIAGDRLDKAQAQTLLEPLAEALPWLLPGFEPEEYREPR